MQDEKGQALADELGGAFAHVDVTDTAQITAAVDAAGELGPLRVLVNSAGIGPAARTVGRDGTYDSAHDLELYKKVIAINLIGTFDAIRIAGTAMSRLEPLDVRRARRDRQHGQRRGVRRPDRAGGVLLLQGRHRRPDPPGRARPRRDRRPGQHGRARA